MSVRSETLGEVIKWLKAQADSEWECAQEGLSDGYDGYDAYTRTIGHCQDMQSRTTATGATPMRQSAGDGGRLRQALVSFVK